MTSEQSAQDLLGFCSKGGSKLRQGREGPWLCSRSLGHMTSPSFLQIPPWPLVWLHSASDLFPPCVLRCHHAASFLRGLCLLLTERVPQSAIPSPPAPLKLASQPPPSPHWPDLPSLLCCWRHIFCDSWVTTEATGEETRAVPGSCAPAVPGERQTHAAIHRGFPPHTGRMRSVHIHPPVGSSPGKYLLSEVLIRRLGFSLY